MRKRQPCPRRVSGAARPAQGSSLTARSGSGCPGNPNRNYTGRRDCTIRNRFATYAPSVSAEFAAALAPLP
ncbi:hypothetical protein F8271_05510 [Micromonospora sp. ALFpr18c]|nr:hypothetical protein F8271_05510 [Micromonospora sp. ALFpr18c]